MLPSHIRRDSPLRTIRVPAKSPTEESDISRLEADLATLRMDEENESDRYATTWTKYDRALSCLISGVLALTGITVIVLYTELNGARFFQGGGLVLVLFGIIVLPVGTSISQALIAWIEIRFSPEAFAARRRREARSKREQHLEAEIRSYHMAKRCETAKQMSPKQLGDKYERFVGAWYEEQGYTVKYLGLELGCDDGGIDLLCRCPAETLLVQCKYFHRRRFITGKIVKYLHGAVESFKAENGLESIRTHGVIVTSSRLDVDARRHANNLAIRFVENLRPPKAVSGKSVTSSAVKAI